MKKKVLVKPPDTLLLLPVPTATPPLPLFPSVISESWMESLLCSIYGVWWIRACHGCQSFLCSSIPVYSLLQTNSEVLRTKGESPSVIP